MASRTSATRAVATLGLALSLTLAGCARSDRPDGAGVGRAPSSAGAPVDTSQVVIRPGDAAAILDDVRDGGARLTLVNVWASWCQPCREEFPELLAFERAWADRGFRLVFVSADFSDDLPQARAFLAAQGVTAPTWHKTGDDMQFIDTLSPDWSGALPGSFLYDSAGWRIDFWEGKVDSATLDRRLRPRLETAAR